SAAEGELPGGAEPGPYMGSSERRTEKPTGPESAQEFPEGGGSFDPDLFFPPRAPEPRSPEREPERRREPEVEDRQPAPPPPAREEFEEEEDVPPAPRHRPVVDYADIEDALEADLAEADIHEEAMAEVELSSGPEGDIETDDLMEDEFPRQSRREG